MMITERQKYILNRAVEEYIDSAQPVSSQLLEKKYDFGICPATIRIEMQKLTDKGFLAQPHTSAGRIPTDKGYRFFVDNLLERNPFEKASDFELPTGHTWDNWLGEEIRDAVKLVQSLTKNLASLSTNFALGYLFDEKILWKEGWEEILQEPEFKETEIIYNFANFLKNFEEEIEGLEIDAGIKIYIGKESPLPKSRDFSIILSGCCFPGGEKGMVSILGPKRMDYNKNIGLINSLTKLIEDRSGS